MQVAQFVVGTTFTLAHLLIAYTIPVSTPYIYSFADLTSGLASDVSGAASIATATASAGVGSWLKKIAFRAAGEEGLAENVRNEQGRAFGIDAIHAAKDLKAREEIRYRDELRLVHCVDTSGQVFAILINCVYLAPLTWLFVRFFIHSYTKRGEHQKANSSTRHLIVESGKDAAKAAKKELDQALDETPGSMTDQNGSAGPLGSKEKTGESKPRTGKEETGDSNNQDGKQETEDSQEQNGEGETGDLKKPNSQQNAGDSTNQNDKNTSLPDSSKDIDQTPDNKVHDDDEQVNKDTNQKAEDAGEDMADDKDADADTDQAEGPDPNSEDPNDDSIEILDSAEAVTDVLDADMETAGKFEAGLENSTAG